MYFGVFFSQNLRHKCNIQYDYILDNIDKFSKNFQSEILKVKSIKDRQERKGIWYEDNNHMTVCFLNGRQPAQWEEEII